MTEAATGGLTANTYRSYLVRFWQSDEQGGWRAIPLVSGELDVPLKPVSRPESTSPAVGQHSRHVEEQKTLMRRAFEALEPDRDFG